jgi:hypothetical protein
METIEFAHKNIKFGEYCETLSNGKAKLLQILPINTKCLTKQFIEYDTSYEDKEGNLKHFPLKEGKALLLIFYVEEYEHLFTTLRRDSKENRVKYMGRVGEEFKVAINE